MACAASAPAQSFDFEKMSFGKSPYFHLYDEDSLKITSVYITGMTKAQAFTNLPPHSLPYLSVVDKTEDGLWFLLEPYWYVLYDSKTNTVFKAYSDHMNKRVNEHMLKLIKLIRQEKTLLTSKPTKK